MMNKLILTTTAPRVLLKKITIIETYRKQLEIWMKRMRSQASNYRVYSKSKSLILFLIVSKIMAGYIVYDYLYLKESTIKQKITIVLQL